VKGRTTLRQIEAAHASLKKNLKKKEKKKRKRSEVAHVCGPSGRKEKRLNASLGQTEKEEKRKVKKK
jgi:hypothetical protein